MSENPSPSPSPSLVLEEGLPGLIDREATRVWTQKWVDQQVQSYRVEALIGTGTYGVVFRARRSVPYERTVAIKLLPNLQGQAKARQFRNECQVLADLDHRGICQILTAGLTEDGTPYLVMPLLRGEPIDDFVEKHEGGWIRIVDLMRQLAAAIAFAHQKGVVHCDLKPDNILVAEDGQLTVTDFGLAVRVDEMDDLAQRPSWAPGTIGYAAPEILTSRKDASALADIYSLGAVLFRLLTGDPPHQASGWLDSLVATVEASPPPVRSVNPNVPRSLAGVCDRCLAHDPASRYESAAELECHLASLAGTQVIHSEHLERRRLAINRLIVIAVLGSVLGLPLLLWPRQAQVLLGWNVLQAKVSNPQTPIADPRAANPKPLSDKEIDRLLLGIEEQLLRPGLKDPASPGDFVEVFEVLREASNELDYLLAQAPTNKKVRQRSATAYFLLGRAAHWVKEDEYADLSLARSEQMFRSLHREYPDEGFMFDYFHTIIPQASRALPRERCDLHFLALGVMEGLHDSHPGNLDYSDALTCVLVLLTEDFSAEQHPDIFDLEKAMPYAQRAQELATWTCSQPESLPIHRKHLMSSASALSLIAELQGDPLRSLELAEVARVEAIRLDEAMKIADTKFHRFDKTVRYAIALRSVGRLREARAFADSARDLVEQLRSLDWPGLETCNLRVEELTASVLEGQPSEI